ncbi:uncharacterized protein METZ01_LOCUS483339, partial [marine metagenome]
VHGRLRNILTHPVFSSFRAFRGSPTCHCEERSDAAIQYVERVSVSPWLCAGIFYYTLHQGPKTNVSGYVVIAILSRAPHHSETLRVVVCLISDFRFPIFALIVSDNMPRTVLGKFRLIGFVEGLSYLLLLGVAVPKWLSLFVMPTAIRVIGMTHGVLFILYCLLLFMAMRQYKWGLGYTIYLFFMALVPFGTFYTDR